MNGKELMEFYEVGSPTLFCVAYLTSSRKTSISAVSSISSATRQYTP